MENVTHTLTGYFLARAGLDRQTPHATAICLVAANIPDIDLVTYTSPINYLNYHRHLTHSLFVVPLMGALAVTLVALWLRLFRRDAQPVDWKSAWPAATIVALSHPLLDLMNPYGMRLWLPFSGRWDSWDALFVWEPWLWVWMFVALFATKWARERGPSQEGTRAAARVAGIALAGILAFIGLKSTLHDRAVEIVGTVSNGGTAIQAAAAFPHVFNPFRWTGVVETADEYRLYDLRGVGLSNQAAPLRHVDPQIFRKLRAGDEVRPALESGVARDYLEFAQYATGTFEPTGDGYVIRLFDLRFGLGTSQRFVCTVTLDHRFRKVSERFDWQ